jgi:hypothetical protein
MLPVGMSKEEKAAGPESTDDLEPAAVEDEEGDLILGMRHSKFSHTQILKLTRLA